MSVEDQKTDSTVNPFASALADGPPQELPPAQAADDVQQSISQVALELGSRTDMSDEAKNAMMDSIVRIQQQVAQLSDAAERNRKEANKAKGDMLRFGKQTKKVIGALRERYAKVAEMLVSRKPGLDLPKNVSDDELIAMPTFVSAMMDAVCDMSANSFAAKQQAVLQFAQQRVAASSSSSSSSSSSGYAPAPPYQPTPYAPAPVWQQQQQQPQFQPSYAPTQYTPLPAASVPATLVNASLTYPWQTTPAAPFVPHPAPVAGPPVASSASLDRGIFPTDVPVPQTYVQASYNSLDGKRADAAFVSPVTGLPCPAAKSLFKSISAPLDKASLEPVETQRKFTNEQIEAAHRDR